MKLKLLIVLLFSLCGCIKSPNQPDINNITVSILPLKYFVDKIGGDDFNVNIMVPPGASPETFELTTMQMKQFALSKTFITLGLLDFEVANDVMIKENFKEADYISLADSMDVKCHDNSCGHHHGADPHVWLSFKNSKIIAEQITRRLIELKPDKQQLYRQRADSLIDRIYKLHEYALNNVKKDRAFLIYHPSLSYLADELNLIQIAIEKDGKEASVAEIKSLVDRSLCDSIKVLLYQQQLSQYSVEAIAATLGIVPSEFDPLAYDWENNMRRIIELLIR